MSNERRDNSRKLTVKRLIIFLILAFFPFYIIIPVMWSYYGEPIFTSMNLNVQTANYVVGVFGMMIPSFAHIITRLVTKEGFRNTYLGADFKGKMGYWTASVIAPLAYSSIALFVIWAVFLNNMSLSETFTNVNLQSIGIILLQLAYSVIVFFPAFGEEWGWRGYMMPKLMELMPKPLAVLVGGVLWGLWHAPLTVAGHNFGVDYPGYPFVGIGIMCLMCTVLNAFLTLITEKTKSIYPAAFCHSVNNSLTFSILAGIFASETALEKANSISLVDSFLPMLIPLTAAGIISLALLIRKPKTSNV